MISGPLPWGNRTGVLEHGTCQHPLASLLVSSMDLEVVVQVECAAGCGHRLYSDRGPVECPCHWFVGSDCRPVPGFCPGDSLISSLEG